MLILFLLQYILPVCWHKVLQVQYFWGPWPEQKARALCRCRQRNRSTQACGHWRTPNDGWHSSKNKKNKKINASKNDEHYACCILCSKTSALYPLSHPDWPDQLDWRKTSRGLIYKAGLRTKKLHNPLLTQTFGCPKTDLMWDSVVLQACILSVGGT